jgi:hypothetical protein
MKKALLIFLLSSVFIAGFCLAPFEGDSLTGLAAERELEIEYPSLPGVETPTTVKTALPDFIRYFFTFSIIIAGILAFGAIVLGGIRYVTSAGAAAAMSDARDQITSGFLGVIILLSSFLILNTINPQLILPEKPPLAPTETGIRIYSNTDDCGATPIDENKEINSMKVFQNLPELRKEGKEEMEGKILLDWGSDGEYKIESIAFLCGPEELTAEIFPNEDFDGTPLLFDYEESEYMEGITHCEDFISSADHRSIKLDWHIPGIYLYAQPDCSDQPKIYQNSSDTLPDFENITQAIKLVGGDYEIIEGVGRYQLRYGVVLHEHENHQGRAAIFDFDTVGHNQCYPIGNITGTGQVNMTHYGVSSITVYQEPRYYYDEDTGTVKEQIIGAGVRFWGDKNYKKETQDYVLPSPPNYFGEGYFADLGVAENKMTSMEMDGHYIVLLFEDEYYKGRCQVETISNPDFRPYPIGQCGWLGRTDCLSSFIVKVRK